MTLWNVQKWRFRQVCKHEISENVTSALAESAKIKKLTILKLDFLRILPCEFWIGINNEDLEIHQTWNFGFPELAEIEILTILKPPFGF